MPFTLCAKLTKIKGRINQPISVEEDADASRPDGRRGVRARSALPAVLISYYFVVFRTFLGINERALGW